MQRLRLFSMSGLTWLSAVLLCAGWAGAAHAACDVLAVDNARVRASPPGVPILAGYFEATNTGDTVVTLTDVSSPQFRRVEMHKSMVDDAGMASMKPVASVALAPGESIRFAPGGYHLMMFHPKQMLMPGNTVKLTFYCRDGQATSVTAEVRRWLSAGGS